MSNKYENLSFFRQRIVRKEGTRMLIQEEEYELLLRNDNDGRSSFPEKLLGEAIVDHEEHKKYLKKIECLLEGILQNNSGIYSINIDPQQLYYEETFLLFERLKKFKQKLKIELTEHLPYKREGSYGHQFLLEQVIRLREMDYEIVLDDFLTGINGIDQLIALSPFISRVKISKLIFNRKVSDSTFYSFIFETAKLVHEINPNLSLVIEAEETEEILEKLPNAWYYQTYYFDNPSKIN
ncbi:EAL domain-containing protein [Lactococcus lactis]|uniref:EAL domain-containing protein n=1 Tax=Lactococcus lactis TaxID=1358 RepID=UPI0038782D34